MSTPFRPVRARRPLAVTSLAAVAALVLTGCLSSDREEGGADATQAAGGGDVDGTFVFAASSDPKTLDPAFAQDGESFRVSRQIFEGLVGVKEGSADPEPLLAESWEQSEDGRTYTFQLREGVTFHDGTAFDAEAVCANFERWYNFEGLLQSENMAYYYGSLFKGFADAPEDAIYSGCEATGEGEAEVTLNKPFAGFIAALSLPAFAMQSPTALEEYGADTAGGTEESPELSEYAQGHPVGTGPFRFDSWDVGNQVVLAAHDDYWGEQGQVTDVIFRIIDDPQARRQALESGSVDGYDLVAPADTQALTDAGYNVVTRDPFTILYLGFNQAQEELADVDVRRAIAHAIDKEALVSQTLPEGTTVATQFIPESVNGYNEDVTEYEYDPERARELLAEAGYADGLELDFSYPTGVSRPYMPNPEQTFTTLTAQLEEVGITVNPQPDKWSPDYLDRINGTPDHDLHLLGWTGDYNDTDNFVGVFFGREKPEFGFAEPELFRALAEARELTSVEEQTPVYEDINEQIMQLLPAVPLANPAPSLAFDPRVESYPVSPVNDEVFNRIELSE